MQSSAPDRVPDVLRASTVYLNGAYLPAADAVVSIFDRGFLMADAVYEVTAVLDGKLLEFPAHMDRLRRSLHALEIPFAVDDAAMRAMHRDLIRRNGIAHGMVYVQITRGVAERDFPFPRGAEPTVAAFVKALDLRALPQIATGLRVISYPEGRWARRDIKTTQMLWTSMGKTAALRAGVDDVFFVENGVVTEASACNAFVIRDGVLRSHALGPGILHGIARAVILRFAAEAGLRLDETAFTVAEAQAADEVFVTASPLFALGVVEVDGVRIGTGAPGPMTMALRDLHIRESLRTAL